MIYEPTEWKTGDIITADKLNNIESGIVDTDEFIIHLGGTTEDEASDAFANDKFTFDKTWNEVYTAFKSKKKCRIVLNPYAETMLGGYTTSEVIGCSGKTANDSMIDTRYSVIFFFNVKLETPQIVIARCNGENAYPELTNIL